VRLIPLTRRQGVADSSRRSVLLRRVAPSLGVILLLATVGAVSAAKPPTPPAGLAGTASVLPTVQYLNDTAGTVFAFSIRNTGTIGIGAVEVARPSTSWLVTSCPLAPAGWTIQRSDNFCRYRSAAGSADDLAPGTLTSAFQLRATTAAGSADRMGTWSVHISSSNNFDLPSALKPAPAEVPGLAVTAFSFQITDAVVAAGEAGDPCPAPSAGDHSAITGSTQTILICGRNRMTVAATPTAALSSLGGTFIADDGTFSSASIPANSAVMVIGKWTGVEITGTSGAGKLVIAKTGSAATRTSPITTLDDVCDPSPTAQTCIANGGYQALNQPPIAVNDSFAVNEDGSLNVPVPGVLANDTDPDGDPLLAIKVSDPANGSLTLAADGSLLYLPNPNFNGSDSFTYRAKDPFGAQSAAATVTIAVIPVNDPPAADDDAYSVAEDGSLSVPAGTGVLAGDTDVDGGTLTAGSPVGPTNGSLTLNADGSFTYTPNANFTGTDSFTYTVSDGNGGTDTGAGTITIAPVNDAPIATNDTYFVNEDGTLVISVGGVLDNDADIDSASLSAIKNGDPAHGTVVLNADGSFLYSPNTDFNGTDSFSYHASDGSADSNIATVTINVVQVNDPPVANDDAADVAEDSTGATIDVLANDTDIDVDDLVVTAVDSTGTTGQITNNGTNITYDPNGQFDALEDGETATDSFTYTVSDGNGGTDTATVTVTIKGVSVNDPPTLAGTEAGSLAYTEDAAATTITLTTTVADVDSANFDTGSLTVDYSVGGTSDDRIEIANVGNGADQIGVSGANVSFAGTTIGTFTGGTGTTPLVVTLNANATPAATQALVRAVTFRNVSDAPSTAARTVRFVLTDGDGGASAPAARSIALTAVNDPPVLTEIEPSALTYTEGDPATAVTSSTVVTDVDSNITGAIVTIAQDPSSDDVLGFVDQLGITGSYNAGSHELTLTGSATPAAYQTALRTVTFQNASDAPSTLTRGIVFQVQDALGAFSNLVGRDILVIAVNDVPVADDETFSGNDGAIGNTSLVVNDPTDGAPSLSSPKKTISGDILAGDVDPDGPGSLTVVPGTFATNDGGSVTIESDGDFVYSPVAGTSCTDTSDFFDYTVTNSSPPALTDVGRVTISIAGCVWYVNNNAAGNSGTSVAPFDTLAQAETSSGTNNSVFVFDGDNTSTGYGTGYQMNAGERLIGEHEGLVVDPDGGGALDPVVLHPANPGAHPTLTASNEDVIALDDGNEVRGFNLDPSGTGGGIEGAAGDTGGGTIDDVNILDTGTVGTQPALELDSTTGTFAISNLAVTTTSAGGVRINNAGTVQVTGGANTIETGTGTAVSVSGTTISSAGMTFQSISSTGASNGIVLATTGASGPFVVTGDGSADSGGTIAGSTGAGIDLTNVGGGVNLTRIKVTGGATDGIRGQTVNGFTLSNGSVTDNGDAAGENGLDFTGLTGTVALTSATITGNAYSNLFVTNDSGTLSATVTGGTIGSNSPTIGNDGILMIGTGTGSMTLNVQSATFTDDRGDHIQMTTDASNTVSLALTVNSSTLSTSAAADPSVVGGGIYFNPGGNAAADVTITNNNIQQAFASAIQIAAPGSTDSPQPVTIDATISGNTIGTAATVDSGSEAGNGIALWSKGLADIDALIVNNTIRQYSDFAGIDIEQFDGNGTLDATVQGNSIANPGTLASYGVFVMSGLIGSESGQTCVDIGHPSTSALKNSLTGSGSVGSTDIRVRQLANTTVKLPGYGGLPGDNTAVAAYLVGRNNPVSTPTASASNTVGAGGAGFVSVASCTLP
jgi:VCBS repeat-containing protein